MAKSQISLRKSTLKAECFLAIIFLLYVGFFSLFSFSLFRHHRTRGDLTAHEQAIWNSSQGRLMQNTFTYSVHGFWELMAGKDVKIPDNSSLLGIHFSLIDLLIMPFYKLFPTTATILTIQTLIIGLGIFPLYKLALRKLKNKFFSIILATSYLMHPAVTTANLFEFHPISLAPTFLLFMLYFLEIKKDILTFVFMFLAFICQENVSLSVSLLGLLLIFMRNKRKRKVGFVLFSLSLIYFISVIYFFIPKFSNYGHYIFQGIYGTSLGGSFIQIAKNSVTKPQLLWQTIVTKTNILYILKLFFSASYICLLSPTWFLLSIWTILPNLLSSNIALKQIIMHYDILAILFIYLGVIEGIKKIKRKKLVILILILTSVFGNILFNRYSPHHLLYLIKNGLSSKDNAIDYLVSLIPADVSVATQDYISGDLARRRKLYLFPVYYNKVDYILISKGEDVWPLSIIKQQNYIEELNNDKNYKLLTEKDNYLLYCKRVDCENY